MDKKKKMILGSAVIGIVVLYLAYTSFAGSVTYYKSIEEVLAEGNSTYDEYIHVAGKVVNGTSTWVPETRTLTFTMTDNNNTMDVSYVGDKPGNFQEDVDVDVAGIYTKDGVFIADKLLFKCPSKYEEGIEEQAQ